MAAITARLARPKPSPPVRDATGRLNLNAKAFKVTLGLDPPQLATVEVPPGTGPAVISHGRRVAARLAVSSTRRGCAGGCRESPSTDPSGSRSCWQPLEAGDVLVEAASTPGQPAETADRDVIERRARPLGLRCPGKPPARA